MCPVVVVQLGYKTPIKPTFGKCDIYGTHGMGSRYAFKAKRDVAAVWFCVASVTSYSVFHPWKFPLGCSTPGCAAGWTWALLPM
jgi:hypothetical protein